jgi:ArsR family transcriptional regulator
MDNIELNLKQIENKVEKATNFLKLFSNKTRILVLCNLVNGRKTVNELVLLIDVKQSALSQHLAKMRVDQILSTQRSGKYIYYKIQDPSVKNIIQILYERFCK